MGTLPGRQAERAGEGRKKNGKGDIGAGDLLLPLLLLPATISMAESPSSTSLQGYSPAWGQQRAFFGPKSISDFAISQAHLFQVLVKLSASFQAYSSGPSLDSSVSWWVL